MFAPKIWRKFFRLILLTDKQVESSELAMGRLPWSLLSDLSWVSFSDLRQPMYWIYESNGPNSKIGKNQAVINSDQFGCIATLIVLYALFFFHGKLIFKWFPTGASFLDPGQLIE